MDDHTLFFDVKVLFCGLVVEPQGSSTDSSLQQHLEPTCSHAAGRCSASKTDYIFILFVCLYMCLFVSLLCRGSKEQVV